MTPEARGRGILQLFAERQAAAPLRACWRGLNFRVGTRVSTKLHLQQEWRWKRVLSGKCETCGGGPLVTKRLCAGCRDAYNAGRQQRRKAAKAKSAAGY